MYRVWLKLLWPIARQGVAFLALAGYLAGVIGVPLPAALAEGVKDTSQPFPCAARQCGCRNAAQCWRGCCCFTNRQKLAWAAEHGVTPPSYVVAAAEREPAPAVCKSACCTQPKAAPAPHRSQEQASAAPAIALEFVVAIQARECQGQADQWLHSGAVMPPVKETELPLDRPCAGELALVDTRLSSIQLSPADPPPRSGNA